tara:strand:+ start:16082 stop:16258 length:177 start_codon:yes stop_codon:yes gene_type:complete
MNIVKVGQKNVLFLENKKQRILSFPSIFPLGVFEKLIATVNEEGQVAEAWLTRKYVLH